jgi:hypothetical protein
MTSYRAGFAAVAAFAAALFGMTGAAPAPSPSPAAMNSDPNKALIDTDDVARFWAAYDASTPADRKEVLQRRYLDIGSPGLHDSSRTAFEAPRAIRTLIDAADPETILTQSGYANR